MTKRLLPTVAAVLFAALPQCESGDASRPEPERSDHQGVPLPPGAILRLGSDRFQTSGLVTNLCFSPDGKQLAWCGGGDAVHLWEAATQKAPRRVSIGSHHILALLFAPGGKALLVASRKDKVTSCRRVVEDARLLFKSAEAALPMSASFTPDGRMLAVVLRNGNIVLRDAAGGRRLRTFGGGSSTADRMEFSADGRVLGIRSYGDRARDEFWDVATGRKLAGAGDRKLGFGWTADSPDGKLRASTHGRGGIGVRDTRTGQDRKGFRTAQRVRVVAFSPDGRLLAGGAGEPTSGDIVVWDTETGKPAVGSCRHTAAVASARYSPDGRSIATAGVDQTVRLWDARTGKQRWTAAEQVGRWEGDVRAAPSFAFSPDGKSIAIAKGNQIRFLDTATGRELRRFGNLDRYVLSLALSPDGQTLATAGRDRNVAPEATDALFHWHAVQLRAATTGKLLWTASKQPRDVRRVCFSPDGRIVAAMAGGRFGSGKRVTFWSATDGTKVRTIQAAKPTVGDYLTALCFSRDGSRLATAANDRQIRLWDTKTGKQLGVLTGPGNPFASLAFTPNGRYLAAVGGATSPGDEYRIRLYNVASGRVVWKTAGHRRNVVSVAFSPDGRSFVTASEDGTALCWSVPAASAPRAEAEVALRSARWKSDREVDDFLWLVENALPAGSSKARVKKLLGDPLHEAALVSGGFYWLYVKYDPAKKQLEALSVIFGPDGKVQGLGRKG